MAGPATVPLIAEGTQIKDYRLGKRLGIGSMGDVYEAVQGGTGRRAAIKVMRVGADATHNAARRLVEEARVMNSVRHPGIVEIYDVGLFEERRPYLVMELLEGRALSEHLKSEKRLSTEDTFFILRGILEALAVAHRAGVIHRDLKPSNVFLVKSNYGPPRPKLLDFGVARREGREEALTGPMMAVGSVGFMSPEQLQGKAVASSDLYAVGCIAFLLVTGKPVFPLKNIADAARAHFKEPAPKIRALRPDAPPVLEKWIDGLLQKDVAARPRSAEAALEALRAVERALPELKTEHVVSPVGRQPDKRTEMVPAFTPPSATRVPISAAPPPTDPATNPPRGVRAGVVPKGDDLSEARTTAIALDKKGAVPQPPPEARTTARDAGGATSDDDDSSSTMLDS